MHIRDETYSAARADLVNASSGILLPKTGAMEQPRLQMDSGSRPAARPKPHVMSIRSMVSGEPSALFYTHVSDQYAPFDTKVVNVGVRDATYVFDGLLYHESDLRIEAHYTDTAGFTDHVFAMMHLLGFRFAPRIRDLADKRLFVSGEQTDYPALAALIGGTINVKQIRTRWDETLRLASLR